ncbi:MAG: hypothetical protein QXX87_01090 [Candidatus Jordarchaeales archaeon]
MMRDVNKYCASEKMKTLLMLSSSAIIWYHSCSQSGKEPDGREVLNWLMDYIRSEADLISSTSNSTLLKHALCIFGEASENVAAGRLEDAVRRISEALCKVTTQADYSMRRLEKKGSDS